MGASDPEVSKRYEEMKHTALRYLETLDKASLAPKEKLAAFEEGVGESSRPICR